MKKYLFAFLPIVFCFSNLLAQDTLYKKSGDIIITKILEVNPTNIKYKNFQFMEGPVYTIDKSELFMIRYQNGLKDVFLSEQTKSEDDYAKDNKPKTQNKKASLIDVTDNPILMDGNHYSIGYFSLNPKKVDQLLLAKNDKPISLMITTAESYKRSSKLLAFAPIPFGVGAYVTLIAGSVASSTNYNQSISSNYLTLAGVLAAAAIGTGIASIVLNAKSKKLRHKAVELYNLNYYNYK